MNDRGAVTINLKINKLSINWTGLDQSTNHAIIYIIITVYDNGSKGEFIS